MPNNELQDILSARFKGHTHTTDESVWAAIESQLDAEKSDRVGFWFWIANGLAATLFIGLMIESTIDRNSHLNTSISQVKTGMNQPEIKEGQIPNQPKVSEDENSQLNKSSTSEASTHESSTDESLSENLLLRESETMRINEEAIEVADFNDIKSQQDNKAAQIPSDLTPLLIQTKTREGFVADLHTRPLIAFSDQSAIPDLRSISSNESKSSFLKSLPIHLGLETSYLKRTYFGTTWFEDTDSTSSWPNSTIEDSRHFEFSFLSQFDLSKRFSTSIGIGYSQSRYVNNFWGASANSDPSPDLLESYQYIFTIPLQAKFAFIRKNRIMVSSGLTLQGEFGQLLISKTEQSLGFLTTNSPMLEDQSYELTKSRIQQFALEPFVQLSIGISPRFSAFGNLGYRWYFGEKITGSSSPTRLNYFNTDIGIMFRIH